MDALAGRAANSALIDAGRVIADKYELVRLLGRGAMGEVWVAYHLTLGEQVAIKLLSGRDARRMEDTSTAAARFLFEAQVAARLSRKTRHIVRVTDHGEETSVAYLVMELLEGETLEATLAREGHLRHEVATNVIDQIARALAHAHAEGVLHRDLKPANVFLTHDEDGRLLVKLLDFGNARVIHARRAGGGFLTAQGLVFGTPMYMSPEQAVAHGKLDHRCDLWALATIGYEIVSGDLPLEGKDTDEVVENLCAGRLVAIRQRAANLPSSLDAFFARAFAPKIADRFASASELAEAFARALGVIESTSAGQETVAGSPDGTPATPPASPTMRRLTLVALAGAFLTFGFAYGALRWFQPPRLTVEPAASSLPSSASEGLSALAPPSLALPPSSPSRAPRAPASASASPHPKRIDHAATPP